MSQAVEAAVRKVLGEGLAAETWVTAVAAQVAHGYDAQEELAAIRAWLCAECQWEPDGQSTLALVKRAVAHRDIRTALPPDVLRAWRVAKKRGRDGQAAGILRQSMAGDSGAVQVNLGVTEVATAGRTGRAFVDVASQGRDVLVEVIDTQGELQRLYRRAARADTKRKVK